MFIIQTRYSPRDKWDNSSKQFKTLEEAKAEYAALPAHIKPMARIAQAYTITRYKAIK